LERVGKIADQHRVRLRPWRDRLVIGIDRFKHHPVGVDMEPFLAAAITQEHALRRRVAVTHFGIEDARNAVVLVQR